MSARWVEKLRPLLGWLEVPNLALLILGLNVLTAVLTFVKPEFPSQLVLDPYLLVHGQVWRALTFIVVPPVPPEQTLFLVLWLLLYYSYMSALQREWGDYKFTLYALLGALSTASAAAWLGAPLGSGMFTASLLLAFARMNPNMQLLLFFVIPVKMRWLAAAFWAVTIWSFVFGGFGDRVAIAAGLLNYILYFGGDHLSDARLAWRRSRYRS